MPKKKGLIRKRRLYELNRLETIKEFMVAELASGSCANFSYDESANQAYEQAVRCWEVLCENEGGE